MNSESRNGSFGGMEEFLLSQPAVEDARVVELAASGETSRTVMAISLLHLPNNEVEPDSAIIQRLRKSLLRHLKGSPSRGLVPRKWVILPNISTQQNSSRPDDEALRHHLRRILGNEEQLPTAERLRTIVADVLRQPLSNINLASSFIKSGGDSITAIELMSRCMAQNISLRVPDIIRCETLAELATTASGPGTVKGSSQSHGKSEAQALFATAFPQLLSYWKLPSQSLQNIPRLSHNISISDHHSDLLNVLRSDLRITEPEILFSAILHSFQQTFPDRTSLTTITIGVRPGDQDQAAAEIPLKRDKHLSDTLRSVKDHFVLGDVKLGSDLISVSPTTELVFRYKNVRHVPNIPTDAPSSTNGTASTLSSSALQSKSLFLIEIERQDSHAISLNFHYPEMFASNSRISDWIHRIQRVMEQEISLLAGLSLSYLSDFPLLPLTYPELDKFVETSIQGYGRIESAYPCSYVQDGILLSQIRTPEFYRIDCIFEAVFRDEHQSQCVQRFKAAWAAVVQKHAALRTIFLPSVRKDATHDQIVLQTHEPCIIDLGQFADQSTAISALQDTPIAQFDYRQPAHLLTIATDDENRLYCKWEISHAVVDGYSGMIILNDLNSTYRLDPAPSSNQAFGKYITSLLDQPMDINREYWSRLLDGIAPCAFPSLKEDTKRSTVLRTIPIPINYRILKEFCQEQGVTIPAFLHMIWGILLKQYTQTDDVIFGYLTSGRDAPIEGIESMVGALINMLICRVTFTETKTLEELLREIQNQLSYGVKHQNISLAELQHGFARGDLRLFNTLVSTVYEPADDPDGSTHVKFNQLVYFASTEYDLTLNIRIRPGGISIWMDYYDSVLTTSQAASVVASFTKIIEFTARSPKTPAIDCNEISDLDIKQIQNDHSSLIPPESCTQWQICDQIHARPKDPAVVAWDRNLTYAELGTFALRLAWKLQNLGVEPEVLVPVCFSKSAWVAVAMTAVQFAGGAFVPLDPSAPLARWEGIISDTKAKLVLCDQASEELMRPLGIQTLVISEANINGLDCPRNLSPKDVISSACEPHNVSFVVFTSGSTGKPKGIIMPHSSISATAASYGEVLEVGPGTRVFQFSAYTFDIGILDVLVTLMRGGCICIPSEQQRLNGLTEIINSTKANWAFLTPTVADLLNPSEVPSMKILTLGGEAIGKNVADKWKGSTKLHGIYGPAEASTCAWNPQLGHIGKSTDIGKGLASVFWVVNPAHPQQLAPVGCIGELVVQTSMLARGYLNVDAKVASAFLDSVKYLEGDYPQRGYRTGDLVKITGRNTFEYIGRKDTQVKLHGQRIELSEIETHIQEVLPKSMSGLVDVKRNNNGSDRLVAVLWFLSGAYASQGKFELLSHPTDEVRHTISKLDKVIRARLPVHMIPSTYLVFQGAPAKTVSGKVDRKNLIKAALETSDIDSIMSLTNSAHDDLPTTGMEIKVRKIWAEVLKIDAEKIGKNDSFLQIGGDSITAIRLVTKARESGILITVKDMFDDPRLAGMASKATLVDMSKKSRKLNAQGDLTQPFSLLPNGQADAIQSHIRAHCTLRDDQSIEDAFPCTGLQEGLMALAVKQPGSYKAKYVYSVPEHVDEQKFRDAWARTVAICSNLRTRIVQVGGSTYQALVTNDVQWEGSCDGLSLQTALESLDQSEMQYNTRLARYSMLRDEKGRRYFVLTIHHTVFDGWTLQVVLNVLSRSYKEIQIPALQPYSSFIKYTMSLDQKVSSDYWMSQLQQAKRSSFPPRKTQGPASASEIFQTKIKFVHSASSSITKATILRAAWALVLGKYSDSDDVCFGTTVSGRQAPISGIEEMAGPAVATVPIRVKLDHQSPVSEFLKSIQGQASDMIAHEQFGLQNILKLSPEIRESCDFSSLLVVQPMQHAMFAGKETADSVLVAGKEEEEIANKTMSTYFSYPLVVQALVYEDDIELLLVYDPAVLPKARLEGLSHHLDCIMQQLTKPGSSTVETLSLASRWDFEQSQLWNDEEQVELIPSCVHQLVENQARRQPDAAAISAWDAEFTYKELNAAANRLAHYLVQEFGVECGDLVHTCFEKSAWFFVAILAINKAGAAWVPLDPSHPLERQRQVTQQTKSTLALTCGANLDLCKSLLGRALEVSASLDDKLTSMRTPSAQGPETEVSPGDPAYVLFTSGSTGVPKGLLMEHGAVCTSQVAIRKRLGLSSSVRILQFAAYVFDLCIGEIIGPLISGACLCVPSEHVRMNGLREFIAEKRVNWAYLTPAFARTLRPQDLPSLELLLLAGEAVTKDILHTWFGKVRLVNGWGPAETCVFSTLHEWTAVDESPLTVGRPVGGRCWIVNPDDPNTLAPVGCLGEVVIQGPTLLREYLRDPERTKASIIRPPEWAPQRSSIYWNRMFRSGDLCSYNADGTIEFASRRDTQIKIRGLRVELGEVEHHIRLSLQGVQQVVVDVVKLGANPSLAAYFCLNDDMRPFSPDDPHESQLLMPLASDLHTQVRIMVSELKIKLPSYMVPSLFIPCRYMPSITSTKLDRKVLRQLTESLDHTSLAAYSLVESEKRVPATQMEIRLQEIWSQVLKLPREAIGRDDSFLQLGGDSISAIQLVTRAREADIVFSVKDLFDDPRLTAVAAKALGGDAASATPEIPAQYGLLPEGSAVKAEADMRRLCALRDDQEIEDIFPCTGLQEGLLALATKQPGSYVAKYFYRLHSSIDEQRFRQAWAHTVSICANLRTRIVQSSGNALQALLKDDLFWEDTAGMDLKGFVDLAKGVEMQYGSRLSRYAMVRDSTGIYFSLLIHHAVFDGWSLQIILETLKQAYLGGTTPSLQPYARFISYVSHIEEDAASAYWRKQLDGGRQATFPSSRRSDKSAKSQTMKSKIQLSRSLNPSVTKATILRAAWAVVLAQYCDTDDVCFGTTVSGRQAPVLGVEYMAGPAVATVPIRVQLDRDLSVSKYLDKVQTQSSEMITYEQFGLQRISKLDPAYREICDFSSLLVIQPMRHAVSTNGNDDALLIAGEQEEILANEAMQSYFSYPLVIQCHVYDNDVELVLIYNPTLLHEAQMHAITQHFTRVVYQLNEQSQAPLTSLSLSGDWDLAEARKHNQHEPALSNTCFHELVAKQATDRPHAPAICAWDKELSYKELNAASNRLAHHLKELGVRKGHLVHTCFEKSAWFFVAMLAINKAGAAWVPLDPGHPLSRQEAIVQQTKAKIVLTSPSNSALCAKFIDIVVEVTGFLDSQLLRKGLNDQPPPSGVSPDDAAYVLFTSGSTGTPKGLVMEHKAVCTSQLAIGERLQLTPDVRILQFAAYVFDLCIGEILGPLIHGACLVVPSEHTRMNGLIEFINEQSISWAYLTPAFARTIQPAKVPGLKLLLLAGEAVTRDILDSWFGKVRLINGWGPAETCVFSTLHEWQSKDESPLTVGRPVGGHCWIVNAENPAQLAPVGCLGEVVIQGPTLLREYLADPTRTRASIISEAALPDWTPKRSSPHWNRFFRSGDLCSYNPDGTIEFSSRKDTQVKIRGLRVELGEVEHHIRSALSRVREVAVDVLRADTGVTLAAYFNFSGETSTKSASEPLEVFMTLDAENKSLVSALIGKLKVSLPSYMVPTLFIPCRYMPSITSTKLDRKSLREMTLKLSRDQIAEYSLTNSEKRAPETSMERLLQTVWAEVLNLAPESIGRDDSFLQLGGDSITAIRLSTQAREAGISLTVKDMFEDPRLSAMATKATECDTNVDEVLSSPFSLLEQGKEVVPSIQQQCHIANFGAVEDVYPCSALQEGLMALAVKQPGSYMARYVYRLSPKADLAKFKAAWEQTLHVCANLRTRIVQVGGMSLQAVISQGAQWDNPDDIRLQAFMALTQKITMQYGSPLCRYAIVNEPAGAKYFVLVIHHAIFDGWSLQVVLDQLGSAYANTKARALRPYSNFIKYTMSVNKDDTRDYWRQQLVDAKRATFPPSVDMQNAPRTSRTIRTKVDLPQRSDNAATTATILRAAWALVLAKYCDTDDVCFGATISGRQAAVVGIEAMAGPAVATIPVRVRMDQQQPLPEFLRSIQSQSTSMIPYEQYGLQNILKLGDDIKEACDFTSLLVIQPMQHSTSAEEGSSSLLSLGTDEEDLAQETMQSYFSYPLVIQGHLYDNHVELVLIYNPEVLPDARLKGLSNHYTSVVHQLLKNESTPIKDVLLTSQWDMDQTKAWNSERVELVPACVHELVEQQAKTRPDAPAISAWDEEFTYHQLNQKANVLANYIQELGVKKGGLVHTCFEKSAWFYVAMLAINKAGAAWVPLDPSHPKQRLAQIARQTQAAHLLVSPSSAEKCAGLFPHIVIVDSQIDSSLAAKGYSAATPPASGVTPDDAAYVLFTSGSTGTPKGLVMQHQAVCTSQTAIRKRLGLTPAVRILQFAAYVFDLCIGEIVGPLIAGSCICVPSEETKLNSLEEFMNTRKVDWAFFTPAFSRTITPAHVPGLELVLLAGEAVTRDILDTWVGKVRLINGWGPAETCVFSTLHEWHSKEESPLNVGRPVGGNCFIVDPDDHSRLAPIGCLGEVVIQGPTLLREYLADPLRTQASIVHPVPAWAPQRSLQPWSRFFKSGDLCSWNHDGTIEFASRRDTQVKIRGLRVELGEVEHNIRSSLKGVRQVAVDVIRSKTSAQLVAYICMNDETRQTTALGDARGDNDELFLPLVAAFKDLITSMAGKLEVTLPSYMVPSLFIPCRYMPSITSTKLDRKRLREATELLSAERIAQYGLVASEKRAPATPTEKSLQRIWADILNISPDSIGRDDSFLRLGGDSISAIRFVTQAREAGIILSVKDVFDDPRLFSVATKVDETKGSTNGEFIENQNYSCEPFELLAGGPTSSVALKVAERLQLQNEQSIEDVYPCTSLQEGLMVLGIKQPGSYVAKYIYNISSHVEEGKFRQAWEATIRQCSNLRTRIFQIEDATIQAVLTNDAVWEDTEELSLAEYVDTLQDVHMPYESRLARYAIVHDTDGQRYFVLTIHHSVHDGWSLQLVFETLRNAYANITTTKLQPYSGFIKYAQQADSEAARHYWKSQLHQAKKSEFPASKDRAGAVSISRTVETRVDFPTSSASSVTKATILRAAWAIILARYCESDDVCFATTISGRQAPISGVDRMTGPAVATVPVRIRTSNTQTVADFLAGVQSQSLGMVAYEQFGLQNIVKLGSDIKEACQFSNLLILQPMSHASSSKDEILHSGDKEKALERKTMHSYFSYPLVIQGHIYEDSFNLLLTYDTGVVQDSQIEALSQHFKHVLTQLLTEEQAPLSEIAVAGKWDFERSQQLAGKPVSAVESCIHQIISKKAASVPKSHALVSTEVTITYSELDQFSDQLAAYLVEHGVSADVMVPICSEKSPWVIVAMLAVMKAGGAYVPIDPAHSVVRRKQLIEEVNAKVLLASPSAAGSCQGIVSNVIELSASFFKQLRKPAQPLKSPSPSSAAYAIFTSGSTGRPKQIIVDHRALSTSVAGLGRAYDINEHSRVFQFSNYVFDVSLGEIFVPLSLGGAVCIPTDTERLEGAAKFINQHRINTAMLTPSFARTFSPAEVPFLKTLVLGGEAPTEDNLKVWADKATLINGYGPAECVIYCSTYNFQSAQDSPRTIGRNPNGISWIVEPNNHERLTPIGCIGELLVQGHAIARGYGRAEDNAKSLFLNRIGWLPAASQRNGRLYKTGDLVRYNWNGTLEYVGRKDTQVKLRGQRIELGGIEYQLKALMSSIEHVAVDVLQREANELLVAFVKVGGISASSTDGTKSSDIPDVFVPMTEELRTSFSTLSEKLKDVLPPYMVPTVYLPLEEMPFNASMKADRKALRDLLGRMSPSGLATFSLGKKDKAVAKTGMELKIRALWAEILGIPEGEIGKNDNFLQIGGDSISAIRLVTRAQQEGIHLTVKDIFQDPRLGKLAAIASESDVKDYTTRPFELKPDLPVDNISKEIHSLCRLEAQQKIEDIYPCSGLQEGLIALAMKQSGSYVAKYIYQLPVDFDESRFRSAWAHTVDLCVNLRTRIVEIEETTLQAVVTSDVQWEDTKGMGLHKYMDSISDLSMQYGSRLCRYALVTDSNGSRYFVLVIHHAVYDGWSLQLVIDTVCKTYAGHDVPVLQPYSGFIKYTMEQNMTTARDWWKTHLTAAKRASFPPPGRGAVAGQTNNVMKTRVPFVFPKDTTITKASLLRTVWAIILAKYCNTDDICFGITISGRQAPVPGIDRMAGPAIATIPFRVKLDAERPVLRILKDVQDQTSEMIAYEQYGLRNILNVSPEARDACDFTSLLVIQPVQQVGFLHESAQPVLTPVTADVFDVEKLLQGYHIYPLVAQCLLYDGEIEFVLQYDDTVLNEFQLQALSEQFANVTQQLLGKLQKHSSKAAAAKTSSTTSKGVAASATKSSSTKTKRREAK